MKIKDRKEWQDFLDGKWQKEIPKKQGVYPIAPKFGKQLYFGKVLVFEDKTFGWMSNPYWEGWFWNKPIPLLPESPEWEVSIEKATKSLEGLIGELKLDLESMSDPKDIELHKEDIKDLESILTLLKDNKLEQAAKLADSLDTFIREMIPSELADFFEIHTKSWRWRTNG